MKKGLLRISGIAAVLLLIISTVPAQDVKKDTLVKTEKYKIGDNDEIIIKRKGDKDSKITIEIKDGNVLVNGKSIDDFDDENVVVIRKTDEGDVFTFATPPVPPTPFRGSWNGHPGTAYVKNSTAFLGVVTEKKETGGVSIKEITKGSAAEKAGLKKGDVITKIDDTKIDDPEDLVETIHGYEPAKKVTVTYKRDGKEQKVAATLGKSSTAYARSYNYNYNYSMPDIDTEPFKMELDGMGRAPRVLRWDNSGTPRIGIRAQDTEDGKGAKVLGVDDESSAEKSGVKEGDIITKFDGQPVTDAESLARLARTARTKSLIKVQLTRDGKSQDLDIKIPKKLKTMNL